ncbi:Ras-related protein RABD2b [Halotydeus destructor]|nr:Ras-related protein RABD2b [Halotydeus destructor]
MATTSAPEFKVILCGEYGVGKTSTFRRYFNDTYIDTSTMSAYQSRQSTLGLDHFTRKFVTSTGRTIKIQLWDTAGLERVSSITSSYYKFAKAALLVYSLNNIESFHCLSQHLLILSMAEVSQVFLIGNKTDLTPYEVTDADLEQFQEQFPKFDGVYRISAKTNDGVQEMFTTIADKLAVNYSFKANFDTLQLHSHTETGCCSHEDDVPSSGGSCCPR